eukprot:380153-Amorphochlora_amoeboformis.AAC.2
MPPHEVSPTPQSPPRTLDLHFTCSVEQTSVLVLIEVVQLMQGQPVTVFGETQYSREGVQAPSRQR